MKQCKDGVWNIQRCCTCGLHEQEAFEGGKQALETREILDGCLTARLKQEVSFIRCNLFKMPLLFWRSLSKTL